MEFKLFSDVIFVKGWTRTCIYNFSKSSYTLCPNDFFYEYQKGENYSEEFIDFCLSEGIGRFLPTELSSNFVDLDLSWEWPAQVTNCIIEYENKRFFDTLRFIEEVGCLDFQLVTRSRNFLFCQEVILTISTILDRSKSVELVFNYSTELADFIQSTSESIFENSKIKSIVLLESNQNRVLHEAKGGMYLVIETTGLFSEFNSHSNLSEEYFTINLPQFTEALQYHSYFNRKLIVNKSGQIVTSLVQEYSPFNLFSVESKDDLLSILANEQLTKFSAVTKDKCEVCKECEFRYMCIDNRIPIERPDGNWYFEEECNYNPFICKWKGEEGYLSLDQSGVQLAENSMVIDEAHLTSRILEIWGED